MEEIKGDTKLTRLKAQMLENPSKFFHCSIKRGQFQHKNRMVLAPYSTTIPNFFMKFHISATGHNGHLKNFHANFQDGLLARNEEINKEVHQ